MLKVAFSKHGAAIYRQNHNILSSNGFRKASLRRSWILPNSLAKCLHAEQAQAGNTPFRKQLKDEAKRKRLARRFESDLEPVSNITESKDSRLKRWRLTVGLEIHAQLNTESKLFSTAGTVHDDTPNTNIALFDLATPGSQPIFQQATLIPALRAALGLSCSIQRKSRFDRKHYYYQDQPAGYQITQYYEPFATGGHLTVYKDDGIAEEDGESAQIGIQQVQLEQDTAKSTLQPPSVALLDFNRVGHPLIEIITLPHIHHPHTAAACVRKIQVILQAVNAVTTGMEMGGLRADVNVSVSPRDSDVLGQRTEIKNLSSFKAVEDAIVAERDRQIGVLESGGNIHGETRGWALGSTETKKLRGKEGEVDYRYMPDPDISPLIIGRDLVERIAESLPELPEETIDNLVNEHRLSSKHARTLAMLDDGKRLDYFDEVRLLCREEGKSMSEPPTSDTAVANWVLHELGGLLNASNLEFSAALIPAKSMVAILSSLRKGLITGTTAKQVLAMVFDGDERPVDLIIERENLGLQPLTPKQYLTMAQNLLDENEIKVKQIQQKKQLGKLQFFVGQMMRQGEGKVEAAKAEKTLKELLGID